MKLLLISALAAVGFSGAACSTINAGADDAAKAAAIAAFCDAGNGLKTGTCAADPCAKATAADVTACCKPDAMCSSINTGADDAAKAAAVAAFCDAGNGLKSVDAACATDTCTKATAADVTACCKPDAMCSSINTGADDAAKAAAIAAFCDAGNGLKSVDAACATDTCTKATAADVTACCKPDAKCSSINAGADDAAKAAAIAAFCDAGNGLVDAAATTSCATDTCTKATAGDVSACCKAATVAAGTCVAGTAAAQATAGYKVAGTATSGTVAGLGTVSCATGWSKTVAATAPTVTCAAKSDNTCAVKSGGTNANCAAANADSAACTTASTAGTPAVTGAANACEFTAGVTRAAATCIVKSGGTNTNCAAATASSAACTTASTAGGVTGAANACEFTAATGGGLANFVWAGCTKDAATGAAGMASTMIAFVAAIVATYL